MNAIGSFLNENSNTIGNLFGTGAQLYGQQNAGQAISGAATAGIGQANTTLGNVNKIWQPQQTLGANADTALSSALGIGGQPANYSNFLNMPGYQFAVEQGTRAAQREAAAMGNAGNSGTAIAIGNQITGTAMQDYNNYINQLYQGAGLGSTANQNLQGANLQTAGNIEQLGMNSGLAQAGVYTGIGTLGMGGNYMGGPNGSGVSRGSGGISGMVGSGVKAVGNWLKGGYQPFGSIDSGNIGATYDPSLLSTASPIDTSGAIGDLPGTSFLDNLSTPGFSAAAASTPAAAAETGITGELPGTSFLGDLSTPTASFGADAASSGGAAELGMGAELGYGLGAVGALYGAYTLAQHLDPLGGTPLQQLELITKQDPANAALYRANFFKTGNPFSSMAASMSAGGAAPGGGGFGDLGMRQIQSS
jgi:hypothetical protein